MVDRMNFLASEEIGPKRFLMPNGFLICQEVPLGRTGMMKYAAGEIPIEPGVDGWIDVRRDESEVFSDTSLASFSGAPFVDEHPQDDVTPTNWRFLSHGYVTNPRRGEGELSDCVVGDIVVTTPEMIAAIQAGKREVSVGYDSSYYQTGRGTADQREIIVNHVALVDKGRCGPRCAIGDRATVENPMTSTSTIVATPKTKFLDSFKKLMKAISTKDEKAIDEAAEETAELMTDAMPDATMHDADPDKDKDKEKTDDEEAEDDPKKDKTKDSAAFKKLTSDVGKLTTLVTGLVKTVDALATKVKDEDKEDEKEKATEDAAAEEIGTKDSMKGRTSDSVPLETAFRDVVSKAEIISPGLTHPTFDARAKMARTLDAICGHRRLALRLAAIQPAIAGFINDGLKGKTVDTLSCAESRNLFDAVHSVKAAQNNGGSTRDGGSFLTNLPGKQLSLADINKANTEKFGLKA